MIGGRGACSIMEIEYAAYKLKGNIGWLNHHFIPYTEPLELL